MQLKDLKKMTAFDDTSDVSDKRLTISKALVFMNEFCNKVYDSFDQSRTNTDKIQSDFLVDAAVFNFNEYVQCFISIVTVCLMKNNITPSKLSDCTKYSKRFLSEKVEPALDFVYQRNALIHKYNMYEEARSEFITFMVNYSDLLMDVVNELRDYCEKHDLLNERVSA